MARLPTPQSDVSNWGAILNDYLGVEHEADGTLKYRAEAAAALAAKADAATVDAAIAAKADAATVTELAIARNTLDAPGGVIVAGPNGRAYQSKANDIAALTSRQLDNFTDIAAWTATSSGVLTSVTSDTDWPRAMKIDTPAASPGTFTEVSRDLVFDCTGRFLSFMFKALDSNFSQIGCGLSVNGRTFASRFETTTQRSTGIVTNRWHRVTFRLSQASANGSPAATAAMLADARAFRFQVFPKAGTSCSVLVADLRLHDNVLPPGLIWSFDDGRADTYTVAYPILAARGIRGAIALETGNVGTAGRCTLAQLQEMYAAGWEFNSHTVSGNGLNSANMASVRTQLRDSYNYLLTSGFPRGARHFVYPGGVWDEAILIETLRHYRTARLAGGQVTVSPFVDDYGLLTPYYFGQGVSLATAKSTLDKIAERGGLAYLSFHSLVNTYSATEDWLISDFTALADYAVSLGMANYLPSECWP